MTDNNFPFAEQGKYINSNSNYYLIGWYESESAQLIL